jgi:hypothetical protein
MFLVTPVLLSAFAVVICYFLVVVAVCRVFGYSQFKYLAVKTSLYFNHNIKRDANGRNRHHHHQQGTYYCGLIEKSAINM